MDTRPSAIGPSSPAGPAFTRPFPPINIRAHPSLRFISQAFPSMSDSSVCFSSIPFSRENSPVSNCASQNSFSHHFKFPSSESKFFSVILRDSMGVAVLHPPDCLMKNPLSHASTVNHPMISPRNPNPDRSNRRRRIPSPVPAKAPTKSPVMTNRVRILKRGEELKDVITAQNDAAASRISDPITEPSDSNAGVNRIRYLRNLYAGSAFSASPPPSELPVPAFELAPKGGVSSDMRRIPHCSSSRNCCVVD